MGVAVEVEGEEPPRRHLHLPKPQSSGKISLRLTVNRKPEEGNCKNFLEFIWLL